MKNNLKIKRCFICGHQVELKRRSKYYVIECNKCYNITDYHDSAIAAISEWNNNFYNFFN